MLTRLPAPPAEFYVGERFQLSDEINQIAIGISLDAEIGIVDDEVRTTPHTYSLYWNTFESLRSKKPCECQTQVAFFTPFPAMERRDPMCAICYGDYHAD